MPRDRRYLELLARIEAVAPDAHAWILAEGEKLDSFKESYLLRNLFSWGSTPQGYGYWEEIERLLRNQQRRRD